jgi:D-sedoheptulose 7-phosphate isomerase
MLKDYLTTSSQLLAKAANDDLERKVQGAIAKITSAIQHNRAVLVCGNGGSAADAMHITGELIGRYLKNRRALKCVCLSAEPATLTALANDFGYEKVFSRQVEAHGEEGGVLWGLSTSGNSPNVVEAFQTARAMGLTTIAMTGESGGKLADLSDILINVPSGHTPLIQQIHQAIYHYICEKVEAAA